MAREVLGDREADVEADEIGEPQRAHRVAVAEHHALVDVGGGGDPLLQHADRLEAEGDAEAAGGEAGRVPDLDALLAQPRDPPAGVVDGSPAVPAPTTSSTSAESGTGLKKCMPRNRSGRWSAPARSVIDSELVLLASNAPGRRDLLGRRQQVAFGVGDLRDGLDDEFHVERPDRAR